jgi:hypothetical protein
MATYLGSPRSPFNLCFQRYIRGRSTGRTEPRIEPVSGQAMLRARLSRLDRKFVQPHSVGLMVRHLFVLLPTMFEKDLRLAAVAWGALFLLWEFFPASPLLAPALSICLLISAGAAVSRVLTRRGSLSWPSVWAALSSLRCLLIKGAQS